MSCSSTSLGRCSAAGFHNREGEDRLFTHLHSWLLLLVFCEVKWVKLWRKDWCAMAKALVSSAFTAREGLLCKCRPASSRVTQRAQFVVFASAAEPKWKQKLAAADEHQEKTRQATLQAQEEYRKKQDALRRQQQSGQGGQAASLDDLEFIPYLTEEGYISDPTQPGVKASLYAIYDENKTLCYIGVSRQVYQSMRLHFARRPLQCHYIKVFNVTKPSRALLEGTRDAWISANGSVPVGNDNGELQNIWENPLDCKPLMTGKHYSHLLHNMFLTYIDLFLIDKNQAMVKLDFLVSWSISTKVSSILLL
ncbi:hypothetical protein M758_3G147900 [Ceratodon purpureus]|nr:hypothetical protein M758_3G147900 [Ceratodon purpureus]